MAEIIGWIAAAILLLTVGRQVYTQWRSGASQGLSRWLFLGQIAASTGFVIYSWLLENWVFVVTNALMLVTAGIGQYIYWRNARESGRGSFLPLHRNGGEGRGEGVVESRSCREIGKDQ